MAELTVRIAKRLADVSRADWDALAHGQSPFLEWDWLSSLEEAGCVRPERGWAAHHILVEQDGRLVGACPVYLKGNSEGEFVFDHQWAYAAERAGVAYYPKLLVGVPFTPATGARFLYAADHDRDALIRVMGGVLAQLCRDNGLSSVHVNFCLPEEREPLRDAGFVERVGMQYQWRNHGYATFDDYLTEFKSKRRTKIRREIREMADEGITIRALSGADIGDDMAGTMFQLYQLHVNKLYWGRQYLNRAFFDLIVERFKRNLCFVVAEREGRVIAGTFNVQKNGVFYGRYWGALEEVRHLHFNVCYYEAIRHCIDTGIQRFEPGAGGEFKQLRGFDPAATYSMHHLSHPGLRQAVTDYLVEERQHMDLVIDRVTMDSKLRLVREGLAEGNPKPE